MKLSNEFIFDSKQIKNFSKIYVKEVFLDANSKPN